LFRIPEGFLDKLVVGPSFLTANYILPRLLADGPARGQRPIDIHARLGSEGTDWYSLMRRDAIAALESMQNLRIASTLGVGRSDYLRELGSSKLCFSPFGYGEVCWRD